MWKKLCTEREKFLKAKAGVPGPWEAECPSRETAGCGAAGCAVLGAPRGRSALRKTAEPKRFKIRDVTQLSNLLDDLAARLFWRSPRFHPARGRGSLPAENTTRTAEVCCARALG